MVESDMKFYDALPNKTISYSSHEILWWFTKQDYLILFCISLLSWNWKQHHYFPFFFFFFTDNMNEEIKWKMLHPLIFCVFKKPFTKLYTHQWMTAFSHTCWQKAYLVYQRPSGWNLLQNNLTIWNMCRRIWLVSTL